MAPVLYITLVGVLSQRAIGLAMTQSEHRSITSHAPWEYKCSADGMRGPQSLWKSAPQAAGSALHNVCVEGKGLPQLYVLGAPKCGSTSIAIDVTNAGVQCAGNVKEYNFWSQANIREYQQNPRKVTAEWLQGMPSCTGESRRLVGDFSPKYLSLVTGSGEHPWEPAQPNNLPPVLASVYGDQADKLVFALMIREPLSRVHSHWHYSGPGTRGNTFAGEVETWLQDNSADFRMATRVWYSSYGAPLSRWLESFKPSQFIVIPYRAYSDHGGIEVCGALSSMLGYNMQCSSETAHGMASHHKSLDEEATPELQKRFRDAMESDKRKLIKLLAEGHKQGMTLPRFQGQTGSTADIAAWLERWW